MKSTLAITLSIISATAINAVTAETTNEVNAKVENAVTQSYDELASGLKTVAPAMSETPAVEEPAVEQPAVEKPAAEAPAPVKEIKVASPVPKPPQETEKIESMGKPETPIKEADTDVIDLENLEDSAEAAKRPTVVKDENSELIDIACEDATLSDILRQFRKTTGANIIQGDSSNLCRRVSVSLKRVTWLQGLTSILNSRGFRLDERNGIYRVVEDLQSVPVFTRTFQINHASAKELCDLFNASYGVKSPQGALIKGIATSFEGANVVVVTASDKIISECETIIKAVDKAIAQIYIEARFLELSSEAMHKLGMNWSSLESWKVSAKNLKTGWEANHGKAAVYETDRKENWYNPKSMVETGKSKTFQDLADGKSAVDYVDANTGDTKYYSPKNQSETGNNSTFTDMSTGKSALDYVTQNFISPNTIGEATGAGIAASDMAWKNAYGFSGQLSADDFSLAMSAFESLGDGKLFSNPKVIVSNGKIANVDMTTKFPNVDVTSQRNTSTTTPYTDVSTRISPIPGDKDKGLFAGDIFYSWGITLSVRPRISPDGLISVEITPTISNLKEFYTPNAGSAGQSDAGSSVYFSKYPIIEMKQITTEFTMKDGATAVIGGLSRTTENDVDTGIPYLRKIPWIGPKLFGWKSREKSQSEIIVCVTVGIANPADLPKDIGLPTNAVLGREYVDGRRKEPGLRGVSAAKALQLDMRTIEEIKEGDIKPGEVVIKPAK